MNQLTENGTISYTDQLDGNPLKGKHLTGGRPEMVQGIAVVKFNPIGNRQPCFKYDTRPDLADLVAKYQEWHTNEEIIQNIRFQQARDEQAAKDQPLLDAMNAQPLQELTHTSA